MHIHSSKITCHDVYRAARIARATIEEHDESRSRTAGRKHTVHLTGESRRAPNRRGKSYGKAATWDQWGVFLAVLFDADPDAVIGSSRKYAYYDGAGDFHSKTNDRFRGRSVVGQARTFIDIGQGKEVDYWPADAHGDHTFRYNPGMGAQRCTKCSAAILH